MELQTKTGRINTITTISLPKKLKDFAESHKISLSRVVQNHIENEMELNRLTEEAFKKRIVQFKGLYARVRHFIDKKGLLAELTDFELANPWEGFVSDEEK